MAFNDSYSFESLPLKTPIIKDTVVASCSTDTFKEPSPQCTILMDEFGQTPDHYYLAKRAPPTFYQARRKLNLQTAEAIKAESSSTGTKRKYRKGNAAKTSKTPPEKPRYDTSLGQLTKKFLKLLADATDGIINLNNACEALDVPKRRLYDITNVLEGAGLIQKTARNNIQWMGRASSPFSSVMKYELEKEIDILEAKENKLDELIYHMKKEVNSTKEEYKEYHYVTAEDIKKIEEISKGMIIGINLTSGGQVIETKDNVVTITGKSAEVEACLLRDDATFMEIKAPNYLYEETEENYTVKIKNSALIVTSDSLKPTQDEIFSDLYQNFEKITGCDSPSSNILSGTMWPECFEDDPIMQNVFIKDIDADEIGSNYLLQNEDQDLDDCLPFPHLDDYSFSMDYAEGLTDLFDCNSKFYKRR